MSLFFLLLTLTPRIVEQDESSTHTSLLFALREQIQLKSVAAHRGRGRRGDEDGRVHEVQALRVHEGFPVRGGNLFGEGDWHYHIQAA